VRAVFISGCGTDIGKTFVARALIAQLSRAGRRVDALKPVATGFDAGRAALSDSGLLLGALGRPVDQANLDRITPWRFDAPLSPDMAAAREGTSIPFGELVAYSTEQRDADVTLIEGIGGIMVPLDGKHTVLDWVAAVQAPVLLVAGSYLGTLSHTLTAVGMLRARTAELVGVVVNESEDQPVTAEETASVLAGFLAPVPVRVMPRLKEPESAPDLLPLLAPHL